MDKIDFGEVVEGCGDVGVLGPQRLLEDRQRPLVERLCLWVAALVAIDIGEVVEGDGGVGVVGPQRLLANCQ